MRRTRQEALRKLYKETEYGFGLNNESNVSNRLLKELIETTGKDMRENDFLVTVQDNYKEKYSGRVYGKTEIIMSLPDGTTGRELDKRLFVAILRRKIATLKARRYRCSNWRRKELWMER